MAASTRPEPERRLRIAEVSELTGVPVHVLRQWEERFPRLNPPRDRANRRYYRTADVEAVRRIKFLLWHERLTTEGARKRMDEEHFRRGAIKTNQDSIDLLDRVIDDVRAMLDLLDEPPGT